MTVVPLRRNCESARVKGCHCVVNRNPIEGDGNVLLLGGIHSKGRL